MFRTRDWLKIMTMTSLVFSLSSQPPARGETRGPAFPARLGLAEALQIMRTQGLDVLLADAQVRDAEGDVAVAGASPNPALTLGYGRVLNYVPQQSGDDANQYSVGLSDQASLFDSLSGKRGLRIDVARKGLAAARLGRSDALRSLTFQVKAQYALVVQATHQLKFAREVAESAGTSLDLNRRRYPHVIDEGELARIETQKLEADQVLRQAILALRAGRVGLAFLLGERSEIPDFEIDEHALDYRVPPALVDATEPALRRLAFERRPDLVEAHYEQARAAAGIDLERRKRFPDLSLFAQYSQTGTGQTALQPPTIGFAVSLALPVLYQQQGELRKAEADYETQSARAAKAAAQVGADVATAFASFVTAKGLVECMQGGLLTDAARARDVTEIQYRAGAGTLIDFLDAQRTFVATHVEYLQDLTMYWTAVYQLEQAVGVEFP
jgi:cobalt-zinc-cadmium efflux system outer membrane protein